MMLGKNIGETMNSELIEKNIQYQKDIKEIAKMIFHSFYYDEEQSLTYPPGSNFYEKDSLEQVYPKAEKIYRFFSSVDDVKKTLRFLHELSPVKGLELMNSL